MKYNYKEGVEKQKSRTWTVLPLFGIVGGLYIFINALAPVVLDAMTPADATAKKLVSLRPDTTQNRAFIPKINLDIAIVPVNGDEKIALENGAIQRAEASGNPKQGGNYVITANRFSLGLTPHQTKTKSPFYHINKLSNGDDVFIDYEGVRYAYKVEERKVVTAADPAIEESTDDDRLTLYAPSGTGHEVVVAKPVGKIVWQDGKPRLKSL